MGALCAVVVALALPSAGVASMTTGIHNFTLQGSNGYSITVLAVAASPGESPHVSIAASNGRATANYSTTVATVTETSVDVDMGDLGEIDVTFRSSGVERPVRSKCGGSPVPIESGHYAGTIVFRGEDGYTVAEGQSAPADFSRFLEILCLETGSWVPGWRGGSDLPGARLRARSGAHGTRPYFAVIKNRPGARALFAVVVEETRGEISISRGLTLVAPPGSFTYGSDMRTATVRPSAPFAGSANFHRDAKPANRWRGNLTVDLPGQADVRLTGGQERANIHRARLEWSAVRHNRAHSSDGSAVALRQHPPAPAR